MLESAEEKVRPWTFIDTKNIILLITHIAPGKPLASIISCPMRMEGGWSCAVGLVEVVGG